MKNLPKIYLTLILVWAVACASGLGIFLFQIFGPRPVNEPDYTAPEIGVTIIFWVIAWAVPTSIIYLRGRKAAKGQ